MVRLLFLLGAGLLTAVPAGAAETDLGRDLSGRGCRAEARYATAPDPTLPMPIDVICGSGAASGGVQAILLPDSADRAALAERLARSAPGFVGGMTCGKPGAADLAGGPALVSACTLPGGWPAFRMMVTSGRLLIQGDGVAASLPAVEQAVRRMAGRDGALAGEDGRRRVQQATGVELRVATNGIAERSQALLEEARLANGRGDHAGAERTYRRALDLQIQGLGPDDPAIGGTLVRLALDVSNQRRFTEAHSLFRRAEPLVERSSDPLARPQLLLAQALDAMNRQRLAEARDLARRAGQAFSALAGSARGGQAGGLGSTAVAGGEYVHALMTEGAAALRLNDLAAANVAAATALDEIDRLAGVPPWWKPEAMALLGEVEGRLGRLDRGEALITAAIRQDIALFGEEPPTAAARLALGRFYAASGRYPQAITACAQALGHGDTPVGFEAVAPCLTAMTATASHDSGARDQILDVLFRAVQRVQMGVADAAVGRVAEAMAAGNAKLAEAVRTVADAERQRSEVRLTLEEELARPRGLRSDERVAWLTDRFKESAARLETAERDLSRRFPDYVRLDSSVPASIAQVRSRLAADQAFVTFDFGRDFGVAVLVTRSGTTAVRIPLTAAQMATMVLDLRGAMVVRGGRPQPFNTALAHRLYSALLAPLEPALAGVRRLDIVAPGPLASLPLALLVTEPSGRGEVAWLAQRFAVASWPSAHVFVTTRSGTRSPAPLPMLGIGDPRGGSAAKGATTKLSGYCRGDGPVPREVLDTLPALPDTGTELRRVASLLGAGADDVLTGTNATESSWRQRSLGNYRVLYFATHALLPAELRCRTQPGLVLSPPASRATRAADDGLLEISEIAGLKLNADLVVLSACNTASAADGAGDGFGGESLSSLAEAFFFAGARSVLASHWSVPSAATAELMTTLFAGGNDIAEALRQAQLGLIRNSATAHPIHWAGFTVIGGTAR